MSSYQLTCHQAGHESKRFFELSQRKIEIPTFLLKSSHFSTQQHLKGSFRIKFILRLFVSDSLAVLCISRDLSTSILNQGIRHLIRLSSSQCCPDTFPLATMHHARTHALLMAVLQHLEEEALHRSLAHHQSCNFVLQLSYSKANFALAVQLSTFPLSAFQPQWTITTHPSAQMM